MKRKFLVETEITMAEARVEGCAEQILRVILVGFHHKKGSTVEYIYPPLNKTSFKDSSLTQSLPVEWRPLPHIALPDGCHNYDSGHVMFTLPDPSSVHQCLYGVSCFRQIDSLTLPSPNPDITRSTVQKAICILCKWPLYSYLLTKLQLVTYTYLINHDFEDTSLLRMLYTDLSQMLSPQLALKAFQGDTLDMVNLLLPFKHRLLQIVKAILLQKRILVYGASSANISDFVTSLVCLFPLHFENLIIPQTSEEGFPLDIFMGPSSLQPYLSLQQLDCLTDQSKAPTLIGVVNPLFEKQHQKLADLFVRVDSGAIDIIDNNLRSCLSLTPPDLRFCHQLLEGMGKRNKDNEVTTWIGSNDWLKKEFKKYFISLLATSLAGDSLSLDDFNIDFMCAWLHSEPYLKWVESSSEVNLKGIQPKHLCEGELSLGDVGRQFLVRASDLGLEHVIQAEKVENAMKKTGQALSITRERVGGWWQGTSAAVVSWWRGEDTHEQGQEESG